jgi:hypothetical protein
MAASFLPRASLWRHDTIQDSLEDQDQLEDHKLPEATGLPRETTSHIPDMPV